MRCLRDRDIRVAGEKVCRDDATNQDSRNERQIPRTLLPPVVPKEGQPGGRDDGAHVSEVARNAEQPVAHQQQYRREEADEWSGHLPGPWMREQGDEIVEHSIISACHELDEREASAPDHIGSAAITARSVQLSRAEAPRAAASLQTGGRRMRSNRQPRYGY